MKYILATALVLGMSGAAFALDSPETVNDPPRPVPFNQDSSDFRSDHLNGQPELTRICDTKFVSIANTNVFQRRCI